MIKRFHELQEKILSYYPEANIPLLKKAYAISTDAHLNQKRASNEPYITHPLTVAGILADMKVDEISIAAALLHDVIEDSQYSREDLNKLFGTEISDIVWGVTKISKISEVDVEDAQAETLKKMIVAMTADVRVILIKLADRLHNIRTLAHLSPGEADQDRPRNPGNIRADSLPPGHGKDPRRTGGRILSVPPSRPVPAHQDRSQR
jgi:guanosine-3',5'-bis(diphosphate) 3'-pyrophosphohydrolase